MQTQIDTSTIPCILHQEIFRAMNEIKLKINHGLNIEYKAKYAEVLSGKADHLAYCPQYNAQQQDCKYCRMLAFLHRKSAELIIKARSLSL
jgi:hypothetical protein